MVTYTDGLQSAAREEERAQTARVSAVPERIESHRRAMLAGGDALAVFFCSLIALNGGTGSRIAAALVSAAVICGVFWACGYYRRSYAVHARDEIYYACTGVALAAVPLLIVLSSISDVPALWVLVALTASAIGVSAVHVRMHAARRAGTPVPYAGLGAVSPGAWHDRESQSFELSKRIFDCTVALLALAVFGPVMLVAAAAIAAEGGPVFFRQARVGRGGRTFRIFKFRTMRPDAGKDWVKPGDNRITKAGAWLRRSSLDELPQLFNVLRGEMSIVGPRPEMTEFAAAFEGSIANYSQRHIVQPGITGWAQVYQKRNLQPEDMPGILPYDLFYVEHASLLLDAAIVLKTAAEVLFHRAV